MIWPNNKKSAAVIIIDFDADRALLSQNPDAEDMQKTLSLFSYGALVGMQRIVDILHSNLIPINLLTPAINIKRHPEIFEMGKELQADFGIKSWDLETLESLSPEDTREKIFKSVSEFESIGISPKGFRLPKGEWFEGLVDILYEAGIQWSTSWLSEDLPFNLIGKEKNIVVEIPYHYVNEDKQSFLWNFAPAFPPGHSRIPDYNSVLNNWKFEFNGSYDEGSLWVLSISPEIMGTPARLLILKSMVEHLLSKDDVWFPSCTELSSFWLDSGPVNDYYHPSEVFLRESGWGSY